MIVLSGDDVTRLPAISGEPVRQVSVASHSLFAMLQRLCSKVACAREAVATLTYDYGDQMAVLGPLGAHREPHAHDLCAIHADRMSAPKGWHVMRHATMGGTNPSLRSAQLPHAGTGGIS